MEPLFKYWYFTIYTFMTCSKFKPYEEKIINEREEQSKRFSILEHQILRNLQRNKNRVKETFLSVICGHHRWISN